MSNDPDARPGLAVRCRGLDLTYRQDGADIVALADVALTVAEGESVAVLGPSGSGKSSLLTTLAGLQPPTAGVVEVLGLRMDRLKPAWLQSVRATDLGLMLQNPARNLLALATVAENIDVAQQAAGGSRSTRRQRTAELLAAVDLTGAEGKRVQALSGGEQQRVALAVALANRPRLLLADEPTSQLDRATGRRVAALLQEAHRREGAALLVVTHDDEVAGLFDRTVVIRDGRLLRSMA